MVCTSRDHSGSETPPPVPSRFRWLDAYRRHSGIDPKRMSATPQEEGTGAFRVPSKMKQHPSRPFGAC
jgi:hypothetical protein